jgi:FtsP/CotA-like multicopper oxidase with cupredoxin domain
MTWRAVAGSCTHRFLSLGCISLLFLSSLRNQNNRDGRRGGAERLQDTVIIPNWTGAGLYPTVTVGMDFRDPNIAGTFVYHCHILDHEDGGMMAKIQVNPAN